MNETTDKAIANRLSAIFPSEDVKNRILDLCITKKPVGVSRKAYYPYYKEAYAKWVRPYIDQMIETKQTIIFDYKTFCSEGQMSEGTLYVRVNQSIRYLVECMDDAEMTYSLWRKVVDITRSQARGGVVVEFIRLIREQIDGSSGPAPRMILPEEDGTPRWRHNMNDWLEKEVKTKPFIQEGLAMTPEMTRELKIELSQVRGIEFVVSASSVKIIPVN